MKKKSLLSLLFLLTTVSCGETSHETAWDVVHLPFTEGQTAEMAQGPHGPWTHQDVYAWDFVLEKGLPVLASKPGKVFWLIDDNFGTGKNSFEDSNHIFVDIGQGRFLTYTHHQARSALTRIGDIVKAGQQLAVVGNIGTIVPHIHLDCRGPSWHQSHELKFILDGSSSKTLATMGEKVTSVNKPEIETAPFRDSVLTGHEFSENGIDFKGGRKAFWLETNSQILFEGKTTKPTKKVWFYLWRPGQPSDYTTSSEVNAQGEFLLAVSLDPFHRGSHWYRITAEEMNGNISSAATLPVQVN